MTGAVGYTQASINRNIMECKAKRHCNVASPSGSINRNIMECKVEIRRFEMGLFGVLIETLWNVKKILSPDWFSVKNGINRNIMECKVRYKGN